MEETKSLSTRGGQRHLRKKFQIFWLFNSPGSFLLKNWFFSVRNRYFHNFFCQNQNFPGEKFAHHTCSACHTWEGREWKRRKVCQLVGASDIFEKNSRFFDFLIPPDHFYWKIGFSVSEIDIFIICETLISWNHASSTQHSRFCPFGFILKPVGPETLIWGVLGVSLSKTCDLRSLSPSRASYLWLGAPWGFQFLYFGCRGVLELLDVWYCDVNE